MQSRRCPGGPSNAVGPPAVQPGYDRHVGWIAVVVNVAFDNPGVPLLFSGSLTVDDSGTKAGPLVLVLLAVYCSPLALLTVGWVALGESARGASWPLS